MIVSAEIQVRALCNGALILFFKVQVSLGQNGDNMKSKGSWSQLIHIMA